MLITTALSAMQTWVITKPVKSLIYNNKNRKKIYNIIKIEYVNQLFNINNKKNKSNKMQ